MGEQSNLLLNTKKIKKLSWRAFAKILDVSVRTLYDLRKEKYTLSQNQYKKIIEIIPPSFRPPAYKLLPDFWHILNAAKKGGARTAYLYGGPSTVAGRKKGGINSQKNRKKFPELYKNCVVRKKIAIPRYSHTLAEFIGIVLGDGGINNKHQIVITLHKDHDADYGLYVARLIKKLFAISPKIYTYNTLRRRNVIGVTLSSVAAVEMIQKFGYVKGNKVKNQIAVPLWIQNNLLFSRWCLRGLMDTDGGIFNHRHVAGGNSYLNIGLSFSNKSVPLLNFVHNTLSSCGFTSKAGTDKKSINIYRENEVYEYMRLVGFSNPYHQVRVEKFLEKKSRRDA